MRGIRRSLTAPDARDRKEKEGGEGTGGEAFSVDHRGEIFSVNCSFEMGAMNSGMV